MGTKRVLVVDDSTTICKLLSRELVQLDYAVTTAQSMEAAIDLCEKQSFDLVMSDLVMPGMGGIKGIKHLRQSYPGLAVIAMTGSADKDESKRRLCEARMVGADALLTKPFTTEDLKDVLGAHVMSFDSDKSLEDAHAMRRVLVVDDSTTMCKLLAKMLSDYGYFAATATSMEEALASEHIVRVDLILTDIFMPGKGGIAGIQEIRANWPEVKIIAMSGGDAAMGKDSVLKAAELIGADLTLKKPFDATALVSAVDSLLPGK